MTNNIIAALALAFGATQAHAAVPVIVDGPLANGVALFNQHVAADKRQQIEQAGMEAQLFTGHVSSGTVNYCYGRIGLSTPQGDDRNSRLPQRYTSSFWRAQNNTPLDDCLRGAAIGAVQDLNNMTWTQLVPDAQYTLPKGGVRRKEPATAGMYFTSRSGLDADNIKLLDSLIGKSPIPQLFDYRQVQTEAVAESAEFDNAVACVVQVGLTARAPEQRGARRPATYATGTNVVSSQQGRTACLRGALNSAMQILNNASWDQNGVLRDMARVREDNLPLPDVRAVAARYLALSQPKPSATTARQPATASGLSPQCRDFFKRYPSGQIPTDTGANDYGSSEANDAALFTLMIACNAQRYQAR